MFKWVCLALAAVVAGALLWMVNDARRELRRSTEAVNAHLPQILDRTRESTETLAELSADLRQLRDLVGATQPRDSTLVAYADRILDAIEASGGEIGLEKKLFGSGLKNVEPAREWVTGARREAVFTTMTSKSKEEVLRRLCENKFGSSWYIRVGDGEPVTLIEWVRANINSN